MGCIGCSTGSNGSDTPRGCNNKGNCGTDSCNKLTVFDWLSNMAVASGSKFDGVEVRFKNSRKEFFRNTENLPLHIGDVIATEASPGHDIGVVTLTGELVRTQMRKKGQDPDGNLPKIYRKATQKDIDIWAELRAKEDKIQVRSREIAIELKLEMKISDVEFQGDGSKAIFYYTANERVDFRQLIKEFAREFGIKIEMKQIGFRQEAARLGGVGSCGRELCCSTWLTDFRTVNTAAARYQQLSLNPQKLAGQCGKLKCCLNFELDTYTDALKSFPNTETILQTEKGEAVCQKIDIFKGAMWFAYKENAAHWFELSTNTVKEIIDKNNEGVKAKALDEYVESQSDNVSEEHRDTVGKESLTRFDVPKPNKNRKNKSKSNKKETLSEKEGNDQAKPKAQNQNRRNKNFRKKNDEKP